MLGKMMGALIGSSIDRRDGRGGVKGALLGVAAQRVVRRMGPFGWLVVGLVVLWKLFFGRRSRR